MPKRDNGEENGVGGYKHITLVGDKEDITIDILEIYGE